MNSPLVMVKSAFADSTLILQSLKRDFTMTSREFIRQANERYAYLNGIGISRYEHDEHYDSIPFIMAL